MKTRSCQFQLLPIPALTRCATALPGLCWATAPRLSGDVLITSLRHKQALSAALNSLKRAQQAVQSGSAFELISADVQEALHSLGEITGETTSEDILEAIFSRFCIGK